MNVLLMEWKSFGTDDMAEALKQAGHTVLRMPFDHKEPRINQEFENAFTSRLHTQAPDFVFSFNYFPVISKVCKAEAVKYVSWVYDSPYVLLYSYTVLNPCNLIFVFDKELYLQFKTAGIHTIHYLPMAANTDRLSSMSDFTSFNRSKWSLKSRISFIGSMYTEKHQFFERLTGITSYTRGYLEGIMEAQMQVYGYNFIEELLSEDILKDLRRVLPMEPSADGVESVRYLYSQYVINRQITALERSRILRAIGEQFPLDLYTPDQNLSIPGVMNHGPIDYYDMAPYVFKTSVINLNITLRSIKSGIPLRAFDIMGAGGFLLTNYQADFSDYLVAGEDFEYYESLPDLLDKLKYYLNHEEECADIARNGFDRIKNAHTYHHRLDEILSYF